MAIAKITTKGQITIPKEIRDYLGLESGSQVEFIIDETGVKLIAINVPVAALSGILHQPGMKAATQEELETAIAEGASDWD